MALWYIDEESIENGCRGCKHLEHKESINEGLFDYFCPAFTDEMWNELYDVLWDKSKITHKEKIPGQIGDYIYTPKN